jgi:hypothetical protein
VAGQRRADYVSGVGRVKRQDVAEYQTVPLAKRAPFAKRAPLQALAIRRTRWCVTIPDSRLKILRVLCTSSFDPAAACFFVSGTEAERYAVSASSRSTICTPKDKADKARQSLSSASAADNAQVVMGLASAAIEQKMSQYENARFVKNLASAALKHSQQQQRVGAGDGKGSAGDDGDGKRGSNGEGNERSAQSQYPFSGASGNANSQMMRSLQPPHGSQVFGAGGRGRARLNAAGRADEWVQLPAWPYHAQMGWPIVSQGVQLEHSSGSISSIKNRGAGRGGRRGGRGGRGAIAGAGVIPPPESTRRCV